MIALLFNRLLCVNELFLNGIFKCYILLSILFLYLHRENIVPILFLNNQITLQSWKVLFIFFSLLWVWWPRGVFQEVGFGKTLSLFILRWGKLWVVHSREKGNTNFGSVTMVTMTPKRYAIIPWWLPNWTPPLIDYIQTHWPTQPLIQVLQFVFVGLCHKNHHLLASGRSEAMFFFPENELILAMARLRTSNYRRVK